MRLSLDHVSVTDVVPGMDDHFSVTLSFGRFVVETWANVAQGTNTGYQVSGWDVLGNHASTLAVSAAPDGTMGDEILTGTGLGDAMDVHAGNDRLLGGGGNDTLTC